MVLIDNLATLRESRQSWRQSDLTVALIPTMGNLHAGHLKLVREARKIADRVVVSIFVNPLQFGPGEDYHTYPRTPEQDTEALRESDVDAIFLPSVALMYPDSPAQATYVEVPGLSQDLCGAFRPGHFRGVTTVVCKLFNLAQPDIAIFGEKDFQQLVLIRKMVADLNMPIQIQGMPTVREANGLAMSSRNNYLSEKEKELASLIYQFLSDAAKKLISGNRDFSAIEEEQRYKLTQSGLSPDYFAIRRTLDLGVPQGDEPDLVVLTATWLGKTRLIDNLRVNLRGD